MQEIYEENSAAWGSDVQLLIVDLPGYESGMADLVAGVTLPVLQDTTADAVATTYGASKWYVYLIDRAGTIRYIHYAMDLADSDRARLLSEISSLTAEARP